jgi:long-chain acyl-CoA synthetase
MYGCGDNKPFIAALITIDPDAIKPWAVANKKEGASVADLAKDPTLQAVIQTAVDELIKRLVEQNQLENLLSCPLTSQSLVVT